MGLITARYVDPAKANRVQLEAAALEAWSKWVNEAPRSARDPQQVAIAGVLKTLHSKHVSLLDAAEVRRRARDVTLIRKFIRLSPLQARRVDPATGYVHISRLGSTAARDLTEVLTQLAKPGPLTRLVLDLRSCIHGPLEAAIDVAKVILGAHPIVTVRQQRGKEVTYTAAASPYESLRLAVLIDGSTSTAGAVLAAAIRSAHRGPLIGEPAAADGLRIEELPLSDGSALLLPTGILVAPGGIPLNRAVTPDVPARPAVHSRTDHLKLRKAQAELWMSAIAPLPAEPAAQALEVPDGDAALRAGLDSFSAPPTQALPPSVTASPGPMSGEPALAATPSSAPEGMVLIPAGEFSMGSNSFTSEQPIHRVTVKSFYLDRFPVTNRKYRAFVEASGHRKPLRWSDVRFNGDEQPVVAVSWFDAKAYCDWAHGRLPTEAEREWAARGGLEEKTYPWGNEPPEGRACFGRDSGTGEPSKVGLDPPNGYGLYDLAGNVFDWCADWYDRKYYATSPANDPQGPDVGDARVVRGGGWCGTSLDVRCAARCSVAPAYIFITVGFRCARSLR